MRPLLLAHPWTPKIDPTGWHMSPKLDGVRAYWDGHGNLWSRQGNRFAKAPPEYLALLPEGVPLDGELYLGPGMFNDTIRAVKGDAGWAELRYVVFDQPAPTSQIDQRPFAYRIREAARVWHDVVEDVVCEGLDHMLATLREFEAQGLEGVMLRQAGSLYEGGRSRTLLKVKTFHDLEVTVRGYTAGKGKHAGRIGALVCELDSGAGVEVGTGLSDAQRENPPQIGARVTIKYQELTERGVPRFPVFVSERNYE
jgi:DNA ligase-1